MAKLLGEDRTKLYMTFFLRPGSNEERRKCNYFI